MVEGNSILKDRFDILFKYIIIGDTSVGKSCVLHHYLRNKCMLIGKNTNDITLFIVNNNSKHTVGVEFG